MEPLFVLVALRGGVQEMKHSQQPGGRDQDKEGKGESHGMEKWSHYRLNPCHRLSVLPRKGGYGVSRSGQNRFNTQIISE